MDQATALATLIEFRGFLQAAAMTRPLGAGWVFIGGNETVFGPAITPSQHQRISEAAALAAGAYVPLKTSDLPPEILDAAGGAAGRVVLGEIGKLLVATDVLISTLASQPGTGGGGAGGGGGGGGEGFPPVSKPEVGQAILITLLGVGALAALYLIAPRTPQRAVSLPEAPSDWASLATVKAQRPRRRRR